jgi:hypothetical protein
MIEDGLPGHLASMGQPGHWLDILFKSRLSSDHKLVGVVISRSATYNRKKQLQICMISNYSITRILQKNQPEVQSMVDDLIRLGYLFKIGNAGAKQIYALTFSKIPLGEYKQ